MLEFLKDLKSEITELADSGWSEYSNIQFSSFDHVLNLIEDKMEEIEYGED